MLNLSALFDEAYYLDVYPEVRSGIRAGTFANGIDHFLRVGRQQGYSPGPFFDSGLYLDLYEDVQQATANGSTTAINHFLNHGQFEGRDPITEFYTEDYLTQNTDVAIAIQSQRDRPDPLTAYSHFIHHGQYEGRTFGPDFDNTFYLTRNPDVAQAVQRQGRPASAIRHYLEYGYFEGRDGTRPDSSQDFSLAENAGVLGEEGLTLVSQFSEDGFELFSFVVERPTGIDVAFEPKPGETVLTTLLADLNNDGELDYTDTLIEAEANGPLTADYLEPGVYYIAVESFPAGAEARSSRNGEDTEDEGDEETAAAPAPVTVQVTPKPAAARPGPFPQPPGFDYYFGRGLVNVGAALGRPAADPLTRAAGDNFEDLNLINVNAAWSQGFTGQGIVVAVLDDGVDLDHPEFQGRGWTNPREVSGNGVDDDGNGYIDDVQGWDFVGNDNDPRPPAPTDDHGTHVAGSIAASRNGTGTTGVAPDAQIMALRVLGKPNGGSDDDHIAPAIRYAVDNGAQVINMSLGDDPEGPNGVPQPPDGSVAQALAYARSKGVLVAIAAGNERDSLKAVRPGEPAFQGANGLAVTVGAIGRDRKIGDFSNPVGGSGRAYAFVVAPGVQVRSTLPGRGYGPMDGTSMATPHVAGVLALLRQANPTATVADLEARLVNTADPNNIDPNLG